MSTRQFVLKSVTKSGQKGKSTKFDSEKTFKSSTPSGAASKAASELCRKKEIKGQCTLNLKLAEVKTNPAGSPVRRDGNVTEMEKRPFSYKIKRQKKKTPVKIADGVSFKYDMIVKSTR
jgi:hypothetical protein